MLLRGQVFELDGKTYFTMGGASSVDRDLRVEGESWWPRELPGEEEFDTARARLADAGWSVDYVVTHDCSERVPRLLLESRAGLSEPRADRLNRFLDELEDRLAFRHWYFGHHHDDRDIDERHTLVYQEVVAAGDGVWSHERAAVQVRGRRPIMGLKAPNNPVGYTYTELAGLLGCGADEIMAALRGQTVGIDEATGDELVYPIDARHVARMLARVRG